MRAAFVVAASLIGALQQTGDGPFTDYRVQTPGTVHKITPQDLPRAFATSSSSNGPQLVSKPADVWPQAPIGFIVDRFATGLRGPRQLRVAPNGDLFVAEPGAGRIRVLRAAAV